MLCTTEIMNLNKALIIMVREQKITPQEREDLLRKAGLQKLESNRWQKSEGAILTMQNI